MRIHKLDGRGRGRQTTQGFPLRAAAAMMTGTVVGTDELLSQIEAARGVLGGVESVVEQMAVFLSLDGEERQEAGIKDNLVRYALGIEDAEDIIADLDQALGGI